MTSEKAIRPNGSGAAAILAAGIGSFAVACIAILADQSTAIKSLLTFYKPTGVLSGVTTVAIVIWLGTWIVLDWLWRLREVSVAWICAAAFALLCLGFLLTCPPIADLF
jgi:hypothetical protein